MTRRWLSLAVRVRQWALDERGAALALADRIEQLRRGELEAAGRSLKDAHDERAAVLRAVAGFRADELGRHAHYESSVRDVQRQLSAAVDKASGASEVIRDEMRHTLSERDLYVEQLRLAQERLTREQDRRASREADEAWSTRGFEQGAQQR